MVDTIALHCCCCYQTVELDLLEASLDLLLFVVCCLWFVAEIYSWQLVGIELTRLDGRHLVCLGVSVSLWVI